MDSGEAAEAVEALDDLGSGAEAAEKYLAIAESPIDEESKDMALSHIMSETAYEKYRKAREAGLTTYQYAKFLYDTADLRADKDANGNSISGSKKKKVIAVIESMGVTSQQYAVLMDIMGYKS